MSTKFLYPLRDPDHPSKVTLVPCPEEVYYPIMRPIWNERKERQKFGLCYCPKEKLIFCDLDCALCEHRGFGKWVSLEAPISDDGKMTLESILTDDAAAPDVLIDGLMAETVLAQLGSEEHEVIIAMSWCDSEREAADHMGIPRSTFKRRLNKVREHVRKLLGGTP